MSATQNQFQFRRFFIYLHFVFVLVRLSTSIKNFPGIPICNCVVDSNNKVQFRKEIPTFFKIYSRNSLNIYVLMTFYALIQLYGIETRFGLRTFNSRFDMAY